MKIPALLYSLIAALSLMLIAPRMPPFQNADEAAHLLRADQISHFALTARNLPDGETGGWVDAGLTQAPTGSDGLRTHHELRAGAAMFPPTRWGGIIPAGFPNTAVYGPVLYVPAAMALAGARALGTDVFNGALAARLAMGSATILLGYAALRLAGTASLWLFTLLLLPMSLSLMAGAAQDGPLLGATALAAALCARLRLGSTARWHLPLACLLLAVIGMARPPYAAFALVLLATPSSWRTHAIGLASAILPVLAWSALNARHVLPQHAVPGQPDVVAQLRGLLAAPWHLAPLMLNTIRRFGLDVLTSFIGQPGWLDVPLPRPFHRLARLIVLAGAALSFATTRVRLGWRSWAGLAGVAGAAMGVVLLEYLTWTPVGADTVGGLQGRYFIPPAMMLAAVLAPAALPAWTRWARWPVLLFPLISLPVLLQAISVRYYG